MQPMMMPAFGDEAARRDHDDGDGGACIAGGVGVLLDDDDETVEGNSVVEVCALAVSIGF